MIDFIPRFECERGCRGGGVIRGRGRVEQLERDEGRVGCKKRGEKEREER